MVCQRCENKWDYKGSKIKIAELYPQYAQCPKCFTSVKINIPKPSPVVKERIEKLKIEIEILERELEKNKQSMEDKK